MSSSQLNKLMIRYDHVRYTSSQYIKDEDVIDRPRTLPWATTGQESPSPPRLTFIHKGVLLHRDRRCHEMVSTHAKGDVYHHSIRRDGGRSLGGRGGASPVQHTWKTLPLYGRTRPFSNSTGKSEVSTKSCIKLGKYHVHADIHIDA